MEFTPRISQILKILLANGTPIGKQEIAEELGVSKRSSILNSASGNTT